MGVLAVVLADVSSGPADAVQVRGRRSRRSASESTVEGDVVAAAPHRTAGDVLTLVPGMFVTQHGGQGKAYQIFYRGFDAVHGQDVELSAGGVPVNDVSNIHGQGYADLHFVPPELVAAVDAQPGCYDPRQGDFAVAGSVQLRLGLAAPGAYLKGTLGSFDEQRLFAAYRPTTGSADSFAAVEVQRTGGFGPSRAAERGSVLSQHTVAIGDSSLRVFAAAYAARFDSAGVLPERDVDGGVDRFATYDPRQGGQSVRAQLTGELTQGTPREGASVQPYVVLRSLRLRENYTGYLRNPNDGDAVVQRNDALTLGARAAYHKKTPVLSPRDRWELGATLRTDVVDQSQRAVAAQRDVVLATTVDARVVAVHVGAYVDAEIAPLPRVWLRGGARVDAFSYGTDDAALAGGPQSRSAQGAALSPRATVTWTVAPGLDLVGSYGEGFRSPQARSLADREPLPFTQVRSLEAGVAWRIDSDVTLRAAAFRTALDADLVFDPTTARNEAVPGTERVGGVTDLVARPGAGFVSSTSATFTRATFTASGGGYTEGALLPYTPMLVVRQDLGWHVVLGRVATRALELHLGGAVTSLVGRPLPFGELGRDVVLFDARAVARWGPTSIGIDVLNLLDAPWLDSQLVFASRWDRSASPSLVPARHLTAGSPRAVLVSVTLHL